MNLQETMSNEELENTDLSKVAALQQKRTLAFMNHFVLTNVQFLNNFMKTCDEKLMNFERKLDKFNASMVLLESKLSSIPELNFLDASIDIVEKPYVDQINTTEAAETPEADIPSKPTNPEYDRFIKMVQVGVPVQAVKIKLSLEGLDPEIFDEILGK